MRARIYQPPKTAMQSGRAGTDKWVLEFERRSPSRPDPLMGWIGSSDTQPQVKLSFATRGEAIAFARREGIDAEVGIPQRRKVRPKAYAENFAYTRRDLWTH